jgi:hypothetical protein
VHLNVQHQFKSEVDVLHPILTYKAPRVILQEGIPARYFGFDENGAALAKQATMVYQLMYGGRSALRMRANVRQLPQSSAVDIGNFWHFDDGSWNSVTS